MADRLALGANPLEIVASIEAGGFVIMTRKLFENMVLTQNHSFCRLHRPDWMHQHPVRPNPRTERPMPKAVKRNTPRRCAPATPAPYSFDQAVSEELAAHPDAKIFVVAAEYVRARHAASVGRKQARVMKAQSRELPRNLDKLESQVSAAEACLLKLARSATTREGAMALLEATIGHVPPPCVGIQALAAAAIRAAIRVGL